MYRGILDKTKTDFIIIWYLVSGIWYLVSGIWYLVSGIWYRVQLLAQQNPLSEESVVQPLVLLKP
jgi:hypothetical protein